MSTARPSLPESGSRNRSKKAQIPTLAKASHLVIASLAGGIALVGFVLIFVGFAQGVNAWALTGGSTIPGGLLGVALRELRLLSAKSKDRKPKSKKSHASPRAGPEAD